jgi:3-oxoacyl-[acyl-carrier protein] reductase
MLKVFALPSIPSPDGNPEKVIQAEDLADLMVAQLKLHPRVVLKHAGLWSTNP